MSWDIVLFNSTQKISSVEDLDEKKLKPVNFDSSLLDHFTNAKIDDGYVVIQSDDHSIEFSLDDEYVSNKIIFLYGEKALFEMIILARKQNWQIYDPGLDAMLNLETPSVNGYNNFKAYLDLVKVKMGG